MPDKPNCYACVYVASLTWSTHSKCIHPEAERLRALNVPLGDVMEVLGKRAGSIGPIKTALNVEGDPHGIKNGWFNWPFDFDPIWLRRCDGFTPKGETAP